MQDNKLFENLTQAIINNDDVIVLHALDSLGKPAAIGEDKLLGLTLLSIHSRLAESTTIMLLNKATENISSSAASEVGVSVFNNDGNMAYKRYSIVAYTKLLVDACLAPRSICIAKVKKKEGVVDFTITEESTREAKSRVFSTITDTLLFAIKLKPSLRLIAQSNSELVIQRLYQCLPDALKEISPRLYEEAISLNSIDIIKKLHSLGMPTLMEKIRENPFLFINDKEIVKKESLAIDSLLNAPISLLISNIDSKSQAELLLSLRGVTPLEALINCKETEGKKVLLSLL